MGRNGLRKKLNRVTDNDDMKYVTNFKKISDKENVPMQHVDELIYFGSVDMISEVAIIYHYGGYFKF
ncbi:hypothetical protein P3S68_001855 [Capsicum galapagoense]